MLPWLQFRCRKVQSAKAASATGFVGLGGVFGAEKGVFGTEKITGWKIGLSNRFCGKKLLSDSSGIDVDKVLLAVKVLAVKVLAVKLLLTVLLGVLLAVEVLPAVYGVEKMAFWLL